MSMDYVDEFWYSPPENYFGDACVSSGTPAILVKHDDDFRFALTFL